MIKTDFLQTSYIKCTLVGNKIVGDVPSFNGFCKDNCKMRQEIFKFWDLVWLILDVWQYVTFMSSVIVYLETYSQ